MCKLNFVLIWSDPRIIFLRGNRPLLKRQSHLGFLVYCNYVIPSYTITGLMSSIVVTGYCPIGILVYEFNIFNIIIYSQIICMIYMTNIKGISSYWPPVRNINNIKISIFYLACSNYYTRVTKIYSSCRHLEFTNVPKGCVCTVQQDIF